MDNFDIIPRQCRGEEIPKDLQQYYQTVNDKTIFQYSNTEKDQILSNVFRTERKDILFKQKLLKNILVKNQNIKPFYYVQILFNFLELKDHC